MTDHQNTPIICISRQEGARYHIRRTSRLISRGFIPYDLTFYPRLTPRRSMPEELRL